MLVAKSGFIEGIRTGRSTYIVGSSMTLSNGKSKFGSTSLFNNGVTGNYVTAVPASAFAFGTGNFTIEFWFYTTSVATQQGLYGCRPPSTNGAYPVLALVGSNVVYYTNNGTRITSSALTNNAWYAISLVRNAGSTKLYINGTQSGATYADSTNYLSSTFILAADDYNVGATPIIGYIDEFRMSNIARYTANYTPATQQFIDDPNTMLLIHFEGANGGTVIVDDNT